METITARLELIGALPNDKEKQEQTRSQVMQVLQ